MSNDDYHCTMTPRCGLIDEEVISGDCVHCECCCDCLACLYGPRDGMLMFPDRAAGA